MKQKFVFVLSILCLPMGFCEDPLKCSEDDDECIRQGTERFFFETAMGDSTRNLKRIEPLIIDAMYYNLSKEYEFEILLQNITITGLKNMSVTDLSVNKTAKIATYIFDPDLEIRSALTTTFQITPDRPSISGFVKAILHLRLIVSYPFEEIVESDGTKQYVIGNESVVSEIRAKPFYQLDSEYLEAASKDPLVTEIRHHNLVDTTALFEKMLTPFSTAIASLLIGNMRESAKTGPAKNFLISPVNKSYDSAPDVSMTTAQVMNLTDSIKLALKENAVTSNIGTNSSDPVVAETNRPAEAKSMELKEPTETIAPAITKDLTDTVQPDVQNVTLNS